MHHYNQTHSIVRNTKNEIRWYLRACVCVCVPEIVGLFLLLSGFLIKRFALITWWHEQTLYPIDENYFDIWNQYQSIYIDIDKSSEFQCEFNLIPYNGQQNQKKGKKVQPFVGIHGIIQVHDFPLRQLQIKHCYEFHFHFHLNRTAQYIWRIDE